MPISPPTFTRNDIKIETRKRVFDGFCRMDTLVLGHPSFAGNWVGPIEREVYDRKEAVCVLLFDPKQDTVILTEQFRVGALEDERSPWLLELVAGMVEPNEQYHQVAQRESQEEAGCTPTELIPICHYWVSPGGSTEQVALYCGIVDSEGVGGIHGLIDEGEDIRLTKVHFNEAYDAIREGSINNAATIMALQWLKINYTDVCNGDWSHLSANF